VDVLSVTHDGIAVRWWSALTHSTNACGMKILDESLTEQLVKHLPTIRPKARKAIEAALYWMREPRNMLMEHYRSEDMATYAGYWNAFESLVSAVHAMRPLTKQSVHEKQSLIRARLKAAGRNVGPDTIARLYKEVVDVGLLGRAEHAIRLCCGDQAERLFVECFTIDPPSRRLYNVRNSINHGTIDFNDLDTLCLLECRFSELRELVSLMLHGALRMSTASLAEPLNSSTAKPKIKRRLWEKLGSTMRRIRHGLATRRRRKRSV